MYFMRKTSMYFEDFILWTFIIFSLVFCVCEIAVQMSITQEFTKVHAINGGGRYFVKFGSICSIDLLASLVL